MVNQKQTETPTVSPDTASSTQVEPTPVVQDSNYQNYHFPEHQVTVKARSQSEAITKLNKQLEGDK